MDENVPHRSFAQVHVCAGERASHEATTSTTKLTIACASLRLAPAQFMRFFWKATPESADHQGVKCKMMKPVTFNETMDMYEHCSTRLQTILKFGRDKAIAEEDARIEAQLGKKGGDDVKKGEDDAKMSDADAPPPAPKKDEAAMEDDEEEAALKAGERASLEEDESSHY